MDNYNKRCVLKSVFPNPSEVSLHFFFHDMKYKCLPCNGHPFFCENYAEKLEDIKDEELRKNVVKNLDRRMRIDGINISH